MTLNSPLMPPTSPRAALDTPPATPAAPATVPPASETAALQAALAGEHACVYGYGVAAAWLTGSAQSLAVAQLSAHRRRRAVLTEEISQLAAVPIAPLTGYAMPFTVNSAKSARKLSAHLETGLAAVYADLVWAATSARIRKLGALAQRDAATLAVRWGDKAQAFPGLTERDA